MEVILRSDVEKLGLKGEVVVVKRGYARNYLLPRKLAEVATPGRVAEIRRIDEERARRGNNFLPAVENRVRSGGYNGNVCSLLPAPHCLVTGWPAGVDTSLRDGLHPTP